MEGNTYMKALFQAIRGLAALLILLGITGCSDSPNETGIEEPKVEHPGFTANVSGAINAEVSGVGIVTYLGPKERDIVTGSRPGYFLISMLNHCCPVSRNKTGFNLNELLQWQGEANTVNKGD
jgi:hypothetical protein